MNLLWVCGVVRLDNGGVEPQWLSPWSDKKKKPGQAKKEFSFDAWPSEDQKKATKELKENSPYADWY